MITNEMIRKRVEEAVGFSLNHVMDGGIPFTALILDHHGNIVGQGTNRAVVNHDPIAHAEVEAIKDACHHLRTSHLQGMTLIASGEPCAICYLSALYAGITEIYFAINRKESAYYGFDYRKSYALFKQDPRGWNRPISKQICVENAAGPFLQYLGLAGVEGLGDKSQLERDDGAT